MWKAEDNQVQIVNRTDVKNIISNEESKRRI